MFIIERRGYSDIDAKFMTACSFYMVLMLIIETRGYCDMHGLKVNCCFSMILMLIIETRDIFSEHAILDQCAYFDVGVLDAFLVFPPWLGCCVRLAGLVFLLSPVLSPSLSPVLAGMLCPPRLACLRSCLLACLASGLMPCPPLSPVLPPSCLSACLPGGLGCFVPLLVLSFSCPRSCPPACFQSCLGCSFRLPGLVFFLSVFQLVWDAVSGFLGLSPSLSPQLVWDAVSVLWACLQNFLCDLCNFLRSTVV